MDEGRSKAIPLRRSRGAAAQRAVIGSRTWQGSIAAAARVALEPPHQVWLVALGGTTLAARAAHAAWSRLVSEGAATERWLFGPRGVSGLGS
jgi:hypothetical protein